MALKLFPFTQTLSTTKESSLTLENNPKSIGLLETKKQNLHLMINMFEHVEDIFLGTFDLGFIRLVPNSYVIFSANPTSNRMYQYNNFMVLLGYKIES